MRAARTIAAATTWGETWSSDAAARRTSSASRPKGTTSVTVGRPTVRVPVLSNSSTRPWARRSKATPPLMITPRELARESPAVMAIGAARISGHGVATTRTATARTASPDRDQARPAATRLTTTKATA